MQQGEGTDTRTREGVRVVVTSGDYEGRVGVVSTYDADRDLVFIDLEAVTRPWLEPFTLGCGPAEIRSVDDPS